MDEVQSLSLANRRKKKRKETWGLGIFFCIRYKCDFLEFCVVLGRLD